MEKLLPIQIQLLDRLSRIKEPVSSQFLANTVSRRNWCTVKFDSFRGFACGNQRLHSLTGYSVSRRRCHCCVPTSPSKVVTEY